MSRMSKRGTIFLLVLVVVIVDYYYYEEGRKYTYVPTHNSIYWIIHNENRLSNMRKKRIRNKTKQVNN